MSIRSMSLKFAVAVAFWALAAAAWGIIYSPTGGFHFATTANITVTGNDGNPAFHGSNGTIKATKTDNTLLQSCGFYTNATNGNFQKSSTDTGSPVLQAPPWPGGGITVQINCWLNDGTNVGWTYGISD